MKLDFNSFDELDISKSLFKLIFESALLMKELFSNSLLVGMEPTKGVELHIFIEDVLVLSKLVPVVRHFELVRHADPPSLFDVSTDGDEASRELVKSGPVRLGIFE